MPDEEIDQAKWHVLWTRSHCEQRVHDHLATKEFEVFLPKVNVWSRTACGNRLHGAPMFPGYLFLRHLLDKRAYLLARQTPGLVAILGERWDRPAIVPDAEIDAIRTVVAAGVPAMAHGFVRTGERVRIRRGPLAGVEGILESADLRRGIMALSVSILRRSIAIEVDVATIEVIAAAPARGRTRIERHA